MPEDADNRHYLMIQDWLKTNELEPEFTESELLEKAKKDKEKELNELKENVLNVCTLLLFQGETKLFEVKDTVQEVHRVLKNKVLQKNFFSYEIIKANKTILNI